MRMSQPSTELGQEKAQGSWGTGREDPCGWSMVGEEMGPRDRSHGAHSSLNAAWHLTGLMRSAHMKPNTQILQPPCRAVLTESPVAVWGRH